MKESVAEPLSAAEKDLASKVSSGVIEKFHVPCRGIPWQWVC